MPPLEGLPLHDLFWKKKRNLHFQFGADSSRWLLSTKELWFDCDEHHRFRTMSVRFLGHMASYIETGKNNTEHCLNFDSISLLFCCWMNSFAGMAISRRTHHHVLWSTLILSLKKVPDLLKVGPRCWLGSTSDTFSRHAAQRLGSWHFNLLQFGKCGSP